MGQTGFRHDVRQRGRVNAVAAESAIRKLAFKNAIS
jgi:hypothetical protein